MGKSLTLIALISQNIEKSNQTLLIVPMTLLGHGVTTFKIRPQPRVNVFYGASRKFKHNHMLF